ncbi:MAG: hypothetical protein B1H06_00635 [Candidatus Cloacimonas sp. 4484_143]|nr:MAG: hypothetical protein B1H06_00635 [Candidatus Cloacimonas sp. 4484_143]
MNIGIRLVGIIMIISLIMISCTQKDNIVGTGGSGNLTPLNVTIDQNSFTEMYSYEDSCAYSNSNTMLVGKYEDETSYSLLRFTSLPDSFYEISNVRISLQIKDRHNFDIVDNMTLQLANINDIEWYENATWWTSSDSTDWNNGEHFSETDYTDYWPGVYEIECEEDSINIIFSNSSILEEWINEDVNSGLVIYSYTDGFLELYTSEYSNDKNPILTFEYRETAEDTLITKTIQTCYDCMIYETDNNYEKWENELKISNIQPINIYTKFDIMESIFTDVLPADYVIADDDTILFLQRITINRAELILNNDGVNTYPLDGSISLSPYFVTSDTINTDITEIPLLTNDDIDDLYISSTTDTLNSEQFIINITKVIQYYISGEYDNNGIVIKSLNVNDNFIHTEFDLEPEIRITFTPPYLEE